MPLQRMLFSCLLSFSIFLGGCDALQTVSDRVSDFIVGFIPKTVDAELGRSARDRAIAGRRLITDPDVQRDFKTLIAPLLAAARDSGFAFDVKIINDPSLNAFALPGGYVYVHTGLITAAGSAEEVLGVVAHELAHVTERHGMEDSLARLGLSAAAMLVMQEVGAIGDVLVRGGVRLAGLKFSRVQEAEADETGWRYLTQARIDPRGMVAFFRRLLPEDERRELESLGIDAQGKSAASFSLHRSLQTMMATHPATAERIAAMQGRLKGWQGPARPATIDFKAFQEKVRSLSR